jgi:hypothetical protein
MTASVAVRPTATRSGRLLSRRASEACASSSLPNGRRRLLRPRLLRLLCSGGVRHRQRPILPHRRLLRGRAAQRWGEDLSPTVDGAGDAGQAAFPCSFLWRSSREALRSVGPAPRWRPGGGPLLLWIWGRSGGDGISPFSWRRPLQRDVPSKDSATWMEERDPVPTAGCLSWSCCWS